MHVHYRPYRLGRPHRREYLPPLVHTIPPPPTTTATLTAPAFTGNSAEDFEEYLESRRQYETPYRAYFSPGLYCPSGWETIGMAARDTSSALTSSGNLTEYSYDNDMKCPDFIYDCADRGSLIKHALQPGETMALCGPRYIYPSKATTRYQRGARVMKRTATSMRRRHTRIPTEARRASQFSIRLRLHCQIQYLCLRRLSLRSGLSIVDSMLLMCLRSCTMSLIWRRLPLLLRRLIRGRVRLGVMGVMKRLVVLLGR
jgi:hypothetical protein